jgi:hypothetical protein
MLRTVLIATSLAVAAPSFAQQVRVINGDIEHIYGPGGQLLDDNDLQARNQRAWEHVQAEEQLAIERRQVEVEIERLKLQAAAFAYASAPTWGYSTGDDWYGGSFIGSNRRFSPRIGLTRRIGISPRMGVSRR